MNSGPFGWALVTRPLSPPPLEHSCFTFPRTMLLKKCHLSLRIIFPHADLLNYYRPALPKMGGYQLQRRNPSARFPQVGLVCPLTGGVRPWPRSRMSFQSTLILSIFRDDLPSPSDRQPCDFCQPRNISFGRIVGSFVKVHF